jgi:hypothetical protein
MKKENINQDDLLGDIIPEINPKKLFDEKEYVTLVVGGEEKSKTDVLISDCISILINTQATREEKDEALATLKEKNAQAQLIAAIKKTRNSVHKTQLAAACWETGLDFSSHFTVFIDLLCENDFSVSLEAFTVIQEMETKIEDSTLKNALENLKKLKDSNVTVVDAIELIEQKLKAE